MSFGRDFREGPGSPGIVQVVAVRGAVCPFKVVVDVRELVLSGIEGLQHLAVVELVSSFVTVVSDSGSDLQSSSNWVWGGGGEGYEASS